VSTKRWQLESVSGSSRLVVSVPLTDTDILVQLHGQGQVKTVGTNVVPVERPVEQAHSLVVTTSSEHVSDDRAGVLNQADDRDGRQQGENVLREN
jgi:hypothetical protein